jgi:FixJ family two-component response regulator
MTDDSKSLVKERQKIFLVDDDPGVRRSLQLLLQARGFDVRSYGAGSNLLADSAVRGAACVVADYRMPEIDGLAMLRILRSSGWLGPAILVTAYHSAELSEQASAAGYNAIVEKPLREHALVDMVTRLVGQFSGDLPGHSG